MKIFITTDSTYTKLYTAVIVRFIKFINIWFNSLLKTLFVVKSVVL